MSDANVVSPIYTHKINGVNVRYFKSPRIAEDGKPDLPWVSLSDIFDAIKYPANARKIVVQKGRSRFPQAFRTLGTLEGVITVTCYSMAAALIDGAIATHLIPENSDQDYRDGAIVAAHTDNAHLTEVQQGQYLVDAMVARQEDV